MIIVISLFTTIGIFSKETEPFTSVYNNAIEIQIRFAEPGELFDLADRTVIVTQNGVSSLQTPTESLKDVETARMKLELIQIKQNQEVIRLLKKIANEK